MDREREEREDRAREERERDKEEREDRAREERERMRLSFPPPERKLRHRKGETQMFYLRREVGVGITSPPKRA